MLTKESYAAVRTKGVSASAKKLIKHLEDFGLTPTTDIKAIKKEYKVILFNRLLEVDPGLKLKHEMLRTAEAKQKLLEETINLDGYTELNEAEMLIMFYKREYGNAYGVGPDLPLVAHGITEDLFLTQYGGDIEAALGDKVIDLTEDESYKKLKNVEAVINDLIKDGIVKGNNQIYHDLSALIPMQWGGDQVQINDGFAYHKITTKVRR